MDQPIVAQGTKSISSSELSHLLYTNDAPSQLEVASLRTSIGDMTGRLAQLHLECEQIEEQLHLCRRALAPIRRVPLEILSEIFEWSVLDSMKYLRGTGRTLLNIGLVCRDWRQASARQWSRLQVNLYSSSLPTSIPCEGIQSWLANAGSTPQSLTLSHRALTDARRDCGCDTGRCLWSDLPALIASITSLDRLCLTFASRSCLFTFLDGVAAHASSLQEVDAPVFSWHALRSLSLVICDAYQRAEPSSGISIKYKNLLSQLPHSLKIFELELGSLPQGEASPAIDVPSALFTNLITLAIGGWDSPAILSMLRHCTNIHTLSLTYRYGSPIWTKPAEQLVLPTVRNLNLTLIPREWNLLGLLRFPSLLSLRIDGCLWKVDDAVGVALGELDILEDGGSSTLQHLVLSHTSASASTLHSILYGLPSLTSLDLDYVSFGATELLELQLKRFNGEAAAQILRPLRQLHVRGEDCRLKPVPLLRCIEELRREGTISSTDTLQVKIIAIPLIAMRVGPSGTSGEKIFVNTSLPGSKTSFGSRLWWRSNDYRQHEPKTVDD